MRTGIGACERRLVGVVRLLAGSLLVPRLLLFFVVLYQGLGLMTLQSPILVLGRRAGLCTRQNCVPEEG